MSLAVDSSELTADNSDRRQIRPMHADPRGYTLMVAGQRTGKTSFLRLLLDTSDISPSASKDQLASVAKFVQGCSGHTSHIRSLSVNIDLPLDPNPLALALTLIDTPSLDFADEHAAERTIQEIIRQVDARFADAIDDVSVSSSHIHTPSLAPRTGRRRQATTTYTCAYDLHRRLYLLTPL